MTLFSASFCVLLLLLVSNPIDARKDPGEYWKSLMKHQSMPETIRARLIDAPESEDFLPSGGESSSTLIETSNNLDILRKFFDFDPDMRSVRPQYIYRGENQDTEAAESTRVADVSGMNQELQSETNMQDRYFWFYDQPKQERVYVTSYIMPKK